MKKSTNEEKGENGCIRGADCGNSGSSRYCGFA